MEDHIFGERRGMIFEMRKERKRRGIPCLKTKKVLCFMKIFEFSARLIEGKEKQQKTLIIFVFFNSGI